MTVQPNNILARTAVIFENFFCCSASVQAVQDDATAYTFPELPSSAAASEQDTHEAWDERQDQSDEQDGDVCSLKQSSSSSTGDKAIASVDSFVSKKSGAAGSIVFLDAMEPRVRPVLHFPASASIKTATTASMSSTHSFYTIPSIQETQTFDSECSLASSTATTQVRSSRSLSSATTARIRTPQHRKGYHQYNSKHDHMDEDDQHSIRHVQTKVLPNLPVLSATDGYRC